VRQASKPMSRSAVQRLIVSIGNLGSLGHDGYISFVLLQPHQSVAGDGPPAASQELDLRISKTECLNPSQ